METQPSSWTLGELARLFSGELDGPADYVISKAASVEANDPQALAFAQSDEFIRQAEAGGVGAVLVPLGTPPLSKPSIRVARPRETFGAFLSLCQRPLPLAPGVDKRASVSAEATIDPTASVGPFAVIERGARIDAGARIYPFAYIGENCHVGPEARIMPHAVLYQDVTVGARSIVHAGAVLGADGFSFVWDGKRQLKIPQIGRTVLADDVEIGANSAVDRAMMGETTVGAGTKLDNLVQIGHNSVIGEHNVFAAQCGIGGSTKIGDRCTFGGQSATRDHVVVGDDTTFGGRSGVTKNVSEPGVYWGVPVLPIAEETKRRVLSRKLPSLYDRVKELERRLSELENS